MELMRTNRRTPPVAGDLDATTETLLGEWRVQCGNELATRRRHVDMTQSELAQHARVTQPTISNAETGHATPTRTNMVKIAIALDCKVTDIWPDPGVS